MQRLAALVPRPRLHLIRFHGVLAPHAKLRAAIVPDPVQKTSGPAEDNARVEPWATCRGAIPVLPSISYRLIPSSSRMKLPVVARNQLSCAKCASTANRGGRSRARRPHNFI